MSRWPHPKDAHIPGRTPRPTESPAYDATADAPVYTVDRMWSENETYLYGIEIYNAGFFWEAQEVWEPVWMRAAGNSRERLLLQGLIQLTNACLKIAMEHPTAALRLLDVAECKLSDAAQKCPTLMGLNLPDLQTSVGSFNAAVRGADPEQATCLLCQRPVLVTCAR
ncbi:MAG: DUF309 domain-containing protein [Pseudomonadota bacterium]